MEMNDRIKYLRERSGLTQEELGEKLGVKKAAINKYETGKVENIKRATIEKLADIFEVSPSYIMGWETEVIPYKPTNQIPILGSVRAGVGGYVCEELIGYEEAHMPNCSSDTHFYLKVKGDSMEPKISEGNLALIKKQDDVESGELGIVLINGDEGVIKKIIKKDDSIELHSFNPYYPPRVFKGKELENVKIIGKVVMTLANW